MADLASAPDTVAAALLIVAAACDERTRQDGTPAVLHPLAVLRLLHDAGERNPHWLAVALLQNVLDDLHSEQCAWELRIRTELGDEVLQSVRLLTDDITLSDTARMAQQIVRMPRLAPELRAIKLADRVANLRHPCPDWCGSHHRLYAAQSRALLAVCRDANAYLATALIETLAQSPWAEAPMPGADTGYRPRGAE